MNEIEAARMVLPGWASWSSSLIHWTLWTLCAALAMGVALNAAKSKLAIPAHWTERARHYAASRQLLLCAGMFCAALAGLWATSACGVLQMLSITQLALLCIASIYIIYLEYGYRLERWVRRAELERWSWVSDRVTILLVLRPILLITLIMLLAMPAEFSSATVIVFVGGSLLMLWSGLGGAFHLAAKLGFMRAAPDSLQRIIDSEARRVGRSCVQGRILRTRTANAFALQVQNTIVFTTMAVEILDERELAAVCQHELGHLGEPGVVLLKRLVPLLFCLVLGSAVPIVHNFGWLIFLAAYLLCFALVLLGLRTMRGMEEHADEGAHTHDEGSYASALEKLYEENLVPAVMRRRTTHPHLYDRILAAGVNPPYPRPEPPPSLRTRTVAVLLIVAGCSLGQVLSSSYFQRYAWDSPTNARLALATGGGKAQDLAAWAGLCEERDPVAAATLLRAAASLHPGWISYPENLFSFFSDESSKESAAAEARAAYERAQEVYKPWYDWDTWIDARLARVEQKLTGLSEPVFIDLDDDSHRQVIVDREPGQYLGHPTTVLLEDGTTMIAVYPKGHGRGAIVMKRSLDAGLTWSERLDVPESWSSSKEVPTIHRVHDDDGKRRLILFSGLYPIRMASSDDDGLSWTELSPIGEFGGIVTMGSVERLANGSYMALFHDDGRFLRDSGERGKFQVFKILSNDAGRSWSEPDVIAEHELAHLCEPGLIRSPDGEQIAVLLRENSRKFNSFVIFSEDEGLTWTEPRELPASLTGDRHIGKYAPDGRLFISFRDQPGPNESATNGDWVGWVGRYEDIVHGLPGQYRLRLKDNHQAADCAYPGVECLSDGTFVSTTYGHWTPGDEPYILSVRFKLSEIDAKAAALR